MTTIDFYSSAATGGIIYRMDGTCANERVTIGGGIGKMSRVCLSTAREITVVVVEAPNHLSRRFLVRVDGAIYEVVYRAIAKGAEMRGDLLHLGTICIRGGVPTYTPPIAPAAGSHHSAQITRKTYCRPTSCA